MTSRRSIQPWDQRLSRSLQFVPGHVSGRVASAQPVMPRRRRVGVGATAAPPPDPPISARIAYASSTGSPVVSMDVGATSTVAFCATRGRKDINVPSGWTKLAEGYGGATGTFGGPIAWAILVAYDRATAHSGVYSWATATSDPHSGYQETVSHHFFGGGLGAWSVTIGPAYSGVNSATYTTPGPGRPFIQFGACSNVYASSPTGLPSGHTLTKGPLAEFGLAPGTYSGATFTNLFIAGTPHTNTFTRPTIGAYGALNSVSFAAAWG